VKKVRNAVIADRLMVSEELEKFNQMILLMLLQDISRLIVVIIYLLIDIQILFD